MKFKVGDTVWDISSGEEFREKAVVVNIEATERWPIEVSYPEDDPDARGIGDESDFELVLNGIQHLKRRHNL